MTSVAVKTTGGLGSLRAAAPAAPEDVVLRRVPPRRRWVRVSDSPAPSAAPRLSSPGSHPHLRLQIRLHLRSLHPWWRPARVTSPGR